MQVAHGLEGVDPGQWDRLAAGGCASPQPFLSHAWLFAMERTGCVGDGTGWLPRHLLMRDAHDRLVGAVPMYAKLHSYGEYVFDWAWADAYQRNGLHYYPKLLSAIPFTPVTGARLLTAPGIDPAVLVDALLGTAQASKVSSLHVLFPPQGQAELFEQAGMMIRRGVQFHWHNRGYADFEAFLGSLTQPKRKKIRAERRKVREAGVSLRRMRGEQLDAADWRFFAQCYDATYAAHHSTPYLNLAFFEEIGRHMPQHLAMSVAERDGRRIAASLLVVDDQRLYGRYWGAIEHVPCLHFEVAYYQTIETAIERGIPIIEGGAQGEHKMARGFEPFVTVSAHWLAHPAFAEAVERFLAREGRSIDGYLDELGERSPFRDTGADGDQPPPSDFIRSTE